MNENNRFMVTEFEPLQTRGAESSWVAPNLGVEPRALPGKRILLVDDEEQLRACLRMVLEADGHHVTEAVNGMEALHLFTIGTFDLVITDFQMPAMEGDKLALGIKSQAPDLPILMVTSYELARRSDDNPVDLLLRKPFTVPDLRDALERLFPACHETAPPTITPTVESPRLGFPSEEQVLQLQA